MKIYLFRHAQKAIDFSGDPDLTPEGHQQASKLLDKVLRQELPVPTDLWVSPKKRTHSTFRPLAVHFGIPLETREDLLEQQSGENLTDFRKRIQNLFSKASENKNAVVYLCSHYDFVVEAMSVIPCDTDLTSGDYMQWSPCQYIGFEENNDSFFNLIEFKRINL